MVYSTLYQQVLADVNLSNSLVPAQTQNVGLNLNPILLVNLMVSCKMFSKKLILKNSMQRVNWKLTVKVCRSASCNNYNETLITFPVIDEFVLICFYTSQSTIFQLCHDGPSWVEPVLSKDQGHNEVTLVKLKPPNPRSRVKHSTTEPLRVSPI